jgi:tRNA(Ile)-lysidine synthase
MTPISPSEFNDFMMPFAPFESSPVLAIAVSGGADSMALALLAHAWAKDQGGKAIGLTVDHQLREASTIEARQVKTWLEAVGMEHHILAWIGEKPKTAIQATARKARYCLLGQWCQDREVKHLLTAHHAQDQLETFLIRLSKGSGLKGLTGIQPLVQKDFGRILRPLLAIHPDRLKATLQGHPFIADPSNENPDFTRVRWRQLLPMLGAEGLTPDAFQETLKRLVHSQKLVDAYANILMCQYVTISPYGYAVINNKLFEESREAVEEIFKRTLAIVGVRDYPVRQQALCQALERLRIRKNITLSGCQILCKTKTTWIVREASAVGADVVVNTPGAYRWDNRFFVDVHETPCRITALGVRGIQILKNRPDIPYGVLKTLPTLWREEELVESLPPFRFIRSP